MKKKPLTLLSNLRWVIQLPFWPIHYIQVDHSEWISPQVEWLSFLVKLRMRYNPWNYNIPTESYLIRVIGWKKVWLGLAVYKVYDKIIDLRDFKDGLMGERDVIGAIWVVCGNLIAKEGGEVISVITPKNSRFWVKTGILITGVDKMTALASYRYM